VAAPRSVQRQSVTSEPVQSRRSTGLFPLSDTLGAVRRRERGEMFDLTKMNWTDVQASAALITGVVSLLVASITRKTTMQLGERRAVVDKELIELRGEIEKGLEDRRYEVSQELEKLRAEINHGIEDRRRQAEERLVHLRDTLEQRQANKRHFYEKQLELCFDAVDSASCLSSETDSTKWEKARLAFWRLYWGKLSIVEDRSVEAAMVALGKIVPAKPVDSPNLPMTSLETPSYKLAHAARDLVLRSWDIEMPEPVEERLLSRRKQ
jgi:F0F1-type ATP synthase membrane subunit b/b'